MAHETLCVSNFYQFDICVALFLDGMARFLYDHYVALYGRSQRSLGVQAHSPHEKYFLKAFRLLIYTVSTAHR